MNFFPTIENKRVILKPLQPEHLDALLPVALEPSLWTVGATHVSNRSDLEKYIQGAIAERDVQTSIPFVIIDKQEQRVAGSTRFCGLVLPHKRTEIGSTWIDPSLQGSGLNKAMKHAMLQYAFETMGLNRVELKTDALNTQSRNAILSIGCTQEGILRHHMITSKGRLRDSVYFSILKEEWPDVKQRVFGKYDL
ncbi:GNAT family protein [Chitinophaga sp. MM2321]|uniref:GNAT family N-acetyltransferase n=1 Tax=Chitinophaga sp. MM2321 TaxID=3137178 RepID=UPI0032D5865C